MNSVKLNIKHPLYILVVAVLLIIMNVNSFAVNVVNVDFSTAESSSNDVVKSQGTYNNMHYTKFAYPSSIKKVDIITLPDVELYPDNSYEYTFYSEGSVDEYRLTANIALLNPQNEIVQTIELFDDTFDCSVGNQYKINEHKGTFYVPLAYNVTSYLIWFMVADDSDTTYFKNFFLYDMQLVNNDPILNGTPIGTPDDSELNNIINEYNNSIDSVFSELPSLKDVDFKKLFNVDFVGLTASMNFVQDIFNRVIDISGFNSVLIFSLAIGLCVYIIGRKVG